MTDVRWIKDNDFNPVLPLWTRANVGEVLPEPPSPLGWDIVFESGTILGWRDCMMERFGIEEAAVDERRPEVMGVFDGFHPVAEGKILAGFVLQPSHRSRQPGQ